MFTVFFLWVASVYSENCDEVFLSDIWFYRHFSVSLLQKYAYLNGNHLYGYLHFVIKILFWYQCFNNTFNLTLKNLKGQLGVFLFLLHCQSFGSGLKIKCLRLGDKKMWLGHPYHPYKHWRSNITQLKEFWILSGKTFSYSRYQRLVDGYRKYLIDPITACYFPHKKCRFLLNLTMLKKWKIVQFVSYEGLYIHSHILKYVGIYRAAWKFVNYLSSLDLS